MQVNATPRHYYTFYIYMTLLALLRLALNFTGFALIAYAIRNVVPYSNDYSTMADLPYQYTIQTFRVMARSNLAHIGGWCLLASTGLHLIMYKMHRMHLIRTVTIEGDAEFPTEYYWIAHLGLLNWLLDIPGHRVPTVFWPHVIIIVFNCTATLAFLCIFYFREPLILCWGCYEHDTDLESLDFGTCLACVYNNAQNAHPPVCDEPGTRCGEEVVRWKTILNKTLVDSAMVAAASFTFYIITVAPKVKFYVLSRELVYELQHHDKSK